MDSRAIYAKRLLHSAARCCRWPDGAPIRLKGLGEDSPKATLLGGFVFDMYRLFVTCDCTACAQKPALVGDDIAEDETCVMTMVAFAFHASGPALELVEHRLYDSGLDEDAVTEAVKQMLAEVIFVLDVPYGGGGGSGTTVSESQGAGQGAGGSSGAGGSARDGGGGSFGGGGRGAGGALRLSSFLRQSAEAAGGSALLGRQVWVHAFTALGPPGEAAAADGGAEDPTLNPVTWFSGRLVRYDSDTGAHAIEYDPGQSLELWQLQDDEYDSVHMAACHMRLAGVRGGQGHPAEPAGLSEVLAAAERPELRGPYVGCLPSVPPDWEVLVLDSLRQLLPKAGEGDAAESAAQGPGSTKEAAAAAGSAAAEGSSPTITGAAADNPTHSGARQLSVRSGSSPGPSGSQPSPDRRGDGPGAGPGLLQTHESVPSAVAEAHAPGLGSGDGVGGSGGGATAMEPQPGPEVRSEAEAGPGVAPDALLPAGSAAIEVPCSRSPSPPQQLPEPERAAVGAGGPGKDAGGQDDVEMGDVEPLLAEQQGQGAGLVSLPQLPPQPLQQQQTEVDVDMEVEVDVGVQPRGECGVTDTDMPGAQGEGTPGEQGQLQEGESHQQDHAGREGTGGERGGDKGLGASAGVEVEGAESLTTEGASRLTAEGASRLTTEGAESRAAASWSVGAVQDDGGREGGGPMQSGLFAAAAACGEAWSDCFRAANASGREPPEDMAPQHPSPPHPPLSPQPRGEQMLVADAEDVQHLGPHVDPDRLRPGQEPEQQQQQQMEDVDPQQQQGLAEEDDPQQQQGLAEEDDGMELAALLDALDEGTRARLNPSKRTRMLYCAALMEPWQVQDMLAKMRRRHTKDSKMS